MVVQLTTTHVTACTIGGLSDGADGRQRSGHDHPNEGQGVRGGRESAGRGPGKSVPVRSRDGERSASEGALRVAGECTEPAGAAGPKSRARRMRG